jgi:hypothetical protein
MKPTDVHQKLYGMTGAMLGYHYKLNPNYDPATDIIPQGVFRRHEIPIAEHLLTFKQGLIDDFLRGFDSLEDAIFTQTRSLLHKKAERPEYNLPTPDVSGDRFADEALEVLRVYDKDGNSVPNPNGWRNVEFKYHDPDANIHWNADPEYVKSTYPTAWKLIEEFGDDCPIINYSYMAPNTVLHRHTGPENRTGEYIRIHIPLIIPEGDLFFEVNGEEIDWSDIFAFNNQLAHSAHNLSNEHRMIFLIDIRRSRVGLPPGEPFNPDRHLYSMTQPFVRKKK